MGIAALTFSNKHVFNLITRPASIESTIWASRDRLDQRQRANGEFDAAMSYLLMAAFEARGFREIVAKRALVQLFRYFRGAPAVRRHLPTAAEFRLQDLNATPGERQAIRQMLDRTTKPCIT